MSDKRSVATDALEVLGTIITDTSVGRDAIHLACEPVVAGERLFPGQDIGLQDGLAYANPINPSWPAIKHVGIVDPFLKQAVFPGQKFLLVVYPRTITSLRHVWSHPDFPEDNTVGIAGKVPGYDPGESLGDILARSGVLIKKTDVEQSQAWIEAYAGRQGMAYSTLMRIAEEHCDSEYNDEYLRVYDIDAHGDIPAEFWDHFETITGKKPKGQNPEYFSCSC